MKLNRILSIILTIAIVSVIIVGCTPANQVNDKDEKGRTVISVGNWPATEGESLTRITKQKAEFEEANPTMAIQPDTWSFDLQSFYSKAASGQLPGLYYANFTEIEKIAAGGYYTDITKGIKRAGYEDAFDSRLLDLISHDGDIVTFPTDFYATGMSYNVDLFEKAGLVDANGVALQPKTWDELVEFAKIIKEKTGKNGFIVPTTNNYGGWLSTPLMWSFGVEFMKQNEDGTYTATFDSPEMVAALKWIRDLKWEHHVIGDEALVTPDDSRRQFALGNVGMMMNLPKYKTLLNYEMPLEHIGAMAVPAGPVRHVTLTGGYCATVKEGSTEDQIDVAIKWLEKTGDGGKVTEQAKKDLETSLKSKIDQGDVVGLLGLSVFAGDNEYRKMELGLIEKYRNIDTKQVKLYNDSLSDTSIELQPEEPVCAQELYGEIDKMIQQILTDENTDIAAMVKKANEDFQKNYLNNLD